MNRRQALQNTGWLAGTALVLPAGLFSGCAEKDYLGKIFLRSEMDLIDEVGETILPETADAPGAKAAQVGQFLDTYVAECLPTEEQQLLKNGLIQLEESSREQMGKPFKKLTADQRHHFLVQLDEQSHSPQTPPIAEGQEPYFPLLKNLIVFSYFTSQVGAEQALRYVRVPGRFEGNFEFQPGDRAWAL